VGNGTAPDLSAWRPQNAKNSFANTHVDSIVLDVSHQHPQLRPGARSGVWCATKLATDAGGWRQINRFGHPMMWAIALSFASPWGLGLTRGPAPGAVCWLFAACRGPVEEQHPERQQDQTSHRHADACSA
jgi:hypothetical protein